MIEWRLRLEFMYQDPSISPDEWETSETHIDTRTFKDKDKALSLYKEAKAIIDSKDFSDSEPSDAQKEFVIKHNFKMYTFDGEEYDATLALYSVLEFIKIEDMLDSR